jgi:hypothetical protein
MKLSANSYAGREDEQTLAALLDMTISGERYPRTQRDLNKYEKRTLGATAEVEDKFYDWLGDPQSPNVSIGSKPRIAGAASALLSEDMRLRQRLAHDIFPTCIDVLPYDAIESLEKVADWGARHRDFVQDRAEALKMIADLANNGIGESGPLLLHDVLWGVLLAVAPRAHWFKLDVKKGGPRAGINNVRDEFGLAPFGRPKPRPPIVHAYIQRVAAREQISNTSLALTLIQLKIADF